MNKKNTHGGKREGAGRPTRYDGPLTRHETRFRPEVIKGIKKLAEKKSTDTGEKISFARYVDDLLAAHIKRASV